MKHPKRPRDPFQLAKQVGDIATGQAVDTDPDAGKSTSAVERGRKGGQKGGKSRMAILSVQQRTELARKAAAKRWKKPAPKTKGAG
jgi:hypothetical protein